MENASTEKLKPKALKAGDQVYLVAPSSRPISRVEVNRCVQVLSRIGLKAIVGKHVLETHGYMAGRDSQRVEDLNQAFNSKEAKAVFFLKGGYGAIRLLKDLDFDVLKQRPKLIMGSHDVSSILLAIHKKTNMNVFYGPNLEDVTTKPSLEFIYGRLKGQNLDGIRFDFENYYSSLGLTDQLLGLPYNNLEENIEGCIIGGNLTSIASLLGTPYEVSFKNRIVFLNDRDERNDILMRWIVQLTLAGKFKEAKAVLFGQFHNCNSRGSYSMHSIQDMIIDHMNNFSTPYMLGLPMNEGGLPDLIPIGAKAKIDAKHKNLEYSELAMELS